ncbi:MAG: pyridoxamine 5'-phosphate oxidase family protein [Myxococcota bacterium]
MDKSRDAERFQEFIKDIRVAMLTTVDQDGELRSRPMATQAQASDGAVFFFTRDNTAKTQEIGRHQEVNLSYASPDDERFVSVSGHAEVIHDRQKMSEMWRPIHRAWFPQGLDDPALALIKVNITKAEYWDASSNRMVQLAGVVGAVLKGKTYEPGEQGKMDLH